MRGRRAHVLLGASLLAGCSANPSSGPGTAVDSGTTSQDSGPSSTGYPDAGTPDTGSAAAGDAGVPAPPNLRQFESNAEGLSDACKVDPAHALPNWTQAAILLQQSQGIWAGLKGQLVAAGATSAQTKAIEDALAAYGNDVTAHASRQAESDANIITLTVPDLFDLFVYPAPSDTLRLDGTFRQLQIDGEYGDFTAAAADLPKVSAVWTRLKPVVAKQAPTRPDIHGSATVTADMDTALKACGDQITAASAAGVVTQAQAGLDLTDVSEQVFK